MGLVLLLPLALLMCGAPSLPLDGLPCPCAAGFVCCSGQCIASVSASCDDGGKDAAQGITPSEASPDAREGGAAADLFFVAGRGDATVIAVNRPTTICADGREAPACPAVLDFSATGLDRTTQGLLAEWFPRGRVLVFGGLVSAGPGTAVLAAREVWVGASGNPPTPADVYLRTRAGSQAELLNSGAGPMSATATALPLAGRRGSWAAVDAKARALAADGELILLGSITSGHEVNVTEYFAKTGALDLRSAFVWAAGDDSSIYTLVASAAVWSPPDPCRSVAMGPCVVTVCGDGSSTARHLNLGPINLVDPLDPQGTTTPLIRLNPDATGAYPSTTSVSVPWLMDAHRAPRNGEFLISGGPDGPTKAVVASFEPGRVTVSASLGDQTNPTRLAPGRDFTIAWSGVSNITDQVELEMDTDDYRHMMICSVDATAEKLTVPWSAMDMLLGSTPAYAWVGTMTGGDFNRPPTADGLNVTALTFRDAAAGYISR
jgi:hypothetical protein